MEMSQRIYLAHFFVKISKKLIPKIDSVTHFHSKNVYFYIHCINSLKVTVLCKFHNMRVDTALKSCLDILSEHDPIRI